MSNACIHQVWKWLQWKFNTKTAYKVRKKIINTLFASLGRSVLGKTVPEVLSTARGRRPSAVPKTKGTVFPNMDRPRRANSVFIIFFRRVLCKQFLCWIFTAAIFKPGVRVRLTFRKMIAVVIWIHNCLFLRSLFTFYVLCSENKTAGKDAKAGKLVAARTRGPDGKIRTAAARAISQSDSRI